MIPSCEAVASSVKTHCDAMAGEIARRVVVELGHYSHGRDVGNVVKARAMAVLLDWFLGEWPCPPQSSRDAP